DAALYLSTGGRYDPVTDTWTPTSTTGAPFGRTDHTAVWTGTRMIVWGGAGETSLLFSGGVYDALSDAWTPMTDLDAPAARVGHTAVWTGDRRVVWGGTPG